MLSLQGGWAAEKCIVLYMEVLKNVVKSMVTATSDASPGQDEQARDLQTLEVSTDGLLAEVFHLILKYSALRGVFLSQSVLTRGQAEDATANDRLVEIITPHMRELLSSVPDCSRLHLERYCTGFVESVETVLSKCVNGTEERLKLRRELEPLVNKLEAFLEHVPPESLLRLCSLLLTRAFHTLVEQDQIERASPSGLLVFKALHLLLNDQESCLLKLHRLSHDAAGRFFELVLRVTDEHSSNADIRPVAEAARLLSLVPSYTVAVTERFMQHCLACGRRDWVALATQCMQHSVVCCKWFGKWACKKLATGPQGKVRYLLAARQYMLGAGTGKCNSEAVSFCDC